MEHTELPISLFDFTDFKAYLLKKGLPSGMYSHDHHNLNNWSKRLGYKSASSLSMVLTGERLPSEDMIERLTKDFKMTGREERYFKLLIELERKKTKNQDINEHLKLIQKMSTEKNSYSIDLQQFSVISEWYYIALKQLISTDSFVEDENWIYKRLRKKVSVGQIKKALKDLEDLEIIKRDENSRLRVVKPGLITTNDIPSSAIKKHHYGMMELAQEALMEQEVDQRQMNSTTMRIKKENLPEAKKFIFDFLKEFSSRYSELDAEDVYQMNVQFFELTKQLKH